MDQIPVPEARSRSRSKTPFVLRSSCDKENCTETDHLHGPIKKNPTVQTINEETEPAASPIVSVTTTTPEVELKDRVKHKKSKIAVSSSNTTAIKSSSATTTTTTTTSIISSEVIVIADDNDSEKSIGKLKKHDSADSTMPAMIAIAKTSTRKTAKKSTKEQNQNETNNEFEKNSSAIRSSTPILTQSIQTRSKQYHLGDSATVLSASNGNSDLSDHAAYKEYKEAGEYWNKYPKTDYTYSKLSPHRRELGSGMVAMPNMSRPSLEHHENRINIMARNNPEQEAYIRQRYQSQKSRYEQQKQTQFSTDNYYDSQDEVDLSELGRYNQYSSSQYSVHRESIVRRVVTSIVSTIYTSWYNMTKVFRRSDNSRDIYYTRIETENKAGIFRTIGSYISSAILTVFRYLYLIISTVLFLDSWLLKSAKPENGNKKRFLLLMLILLPLLLLGGTYYYLEKPLPISISSKAVNEFMNDPLFYLDDAKVIAFKQYDTISTVSNDVWNNLKEIVSESANDIKTWGSAYVG